MLGVITTYKSNIDILYNLGEDHDESIGNVMNSALDNSNNKRSHTDVSLKQKQNIDNRYVLAFKEGRGRIGKGDSKNNAKKLAKEHTAVNSKQAQKVKFK